jgi:hypothetical protein
METRLVEGTDLSLLEQVRAAARTLETLGANRALLERLPKEERNRLHKAIAGVHEPDRAATG